MAARRRATQDLDCFVELLGSGRSLSGAPQGATPFMENVALVSRQSVALEARPSAVEGHVRLVETVLESKHDTLRKADLTDPRTPVLTVAIELGAALEVGSRGGQAADFGAGAGELGTYPELEVRRTPVHDDREPVLQ
jgi:hypothetical protein